MMKTHQFSSLKQMETGANSVGEFVLAAVDERGMLHQGVGVDPGVAALVCVLIAEKKLRGEWNAGVVVPADPRIAALHHVVGETEGGWIQKHRLTEILEMKEEVLYGEGS